MLNRGGVAQRLRFVVVAGELVGPREALDQLAALGKAAAAANVKFSPAEAESSRILTRLGTDYYLGRPGRRR